LESAGERADRPTLPTSSRRGWATALAAVALGTLVCLVYSRSVGAPFIFDDAGSVLQNRSIVQLWPLVGDANRPGPLKPPPFGSTSGRPLVNLSLALNYHWGRLDPIGYHVFNIFVHLASTLLLWAIVRRTLRLESFGGRYDRTSGPLALTVAALWALHPLATEAVVYVTQRTELMMALFYLATMYASLRYWTAASRAVRLAWLMLALAACAAGMASKEVMVSAPLVVLLFERTFIADTFRNCWRRSWPLYLGLAATWGVLFVLNFGGPRGDTAGFHLGVPLVAWWCTQAKFFWMYLKLAVWPWPLVIHYELPQLASFGDAWPHVVAAVAVVVATMALVWRRNAAGFLAACVLLILVPTHVVPITTETAAERRMYLPLAAIMTLVVVGGYALMRRLSQQGEQDASHSTRGRSARLASVIAVLVLLVVYSLLTSRRLAEYSNPLELWQGVVAVQPHNHVAQHNLAVGYAAAAQNAEAVQHFREALRSKPDFLEARYGLGLTLASSGELEEGIQHLEQAVRLKPDAVKIRNNLGVLLFSAERVDEAVVAFQNAVDLDPDFADAHANLGRALRHVGKPEEAIAECRRAIELNPNDLQSHSDLAAVYRETNQPAAAIDAMQQAIRLARAYNYLQVADEIEQQLADYRADLAAADVPHEAPEPRRADPPSPP
jgi:tetratricopeptide (TPR) repeat protein